MAAEMSEANIKRKYESPRQVARQTKILATAREMLDEGGYEGLTMRGLAQRAGVAQGTLYNLYGSKDDLIFEAVDDLLAGLAEHIRNRAPSPGIDAILVHSEMSAQSIRSQPAYAEAMTRIVMGIQQDSPMVDVVFARFVPALLENLTAADREGELEQGLDLEAIAKHMTGNAWSVTLLWIMGLIDMDEFEKERERNTLLTLVGITTGNRRAQLRERLNRLQLR